MSSSFTHYEPTITFDPASLLPNFEEAAWEQVQLYDERRNGLQAIMDRAASHTSNYVKRYVDNVVQEMNEHYEHAFVNVYQQLVNSAQRLERSNEALLKQAERITELEKASAAHKATLDQIPAGGTSQGVAGGRGMKIPDPPTFSGSDDKMKLDDWLNQIALYCSASGTVNDHQKIVAALTRLRAPAATYMKDYYEKNKSGASLGYFADFEKQLVAIYGQRDTKETAK